MGFLSVMGKITIGIAIIAPVVALYFAMTSSDALGLTGVVGLLAGSGIFCISGLYAGLLGIKVEKLSARLDPVSRQRPRTKAKNLIKAECPIDHREGVFVHVSPFRSDAVPDGLDLFLGSCGHEVHRGEIEAEA
ncbi:hypothetical protein AUF78_14285 [archaeon 13_1_20CM_2_51_12]|nr:MAG: hypothetical protein AUI97_08415 [Crenarchaeota archaeon 13_1_40CM_3_52_17]OLE68815.1 MAG: hypothetical protein AUF78_14285 [archaeon 13_1_20CM_2_51_12]